VLPRDFWYSDQMLDAFRSWHMGKVINAYRLHPHHRRPLRQIDVCRWLGMAQSRLSALENAQVPPADLGRLIHYAVTLRMPAELLWFKLPEAREEAPAELAQAPMAIADEGGIRSSGVTTYTQQEAISSPADQGDPVKRREFLIDGASIGAGAVAATSAAGLLAELRQSPVPARVGPAEIERVHLAALFFDEISHAHGGDAIWEAITAQLQWSAGLLRADCPPALRPGMFSAVGLLADVCGFMAFDAYRHADARRMFGFGLACAEEAGDWDQRAGQLADMAQQAIWRGDPDGALVSADLALVRPDRLAASHAARAHAMRARALAILGRVQDAKRAIGQADEAFAGWDAASERPIMAYYTGAEHAAETAYPLFEIAMRDPGRADPASRFRTAVGGYGDDYTRSRAMSGATLATFLFASGDPREAAAVGGQAVASAQGLRSPRVTDHLRRLRQAAAAHPTIPEATDLVRRTTDLIAV
jgi:hypothetical protein